MTSPGVLPFTVVPSVVTVFPDVSALRRRFLSEFALGGIFVPGPSEARVGQHVCLDVALIHESICLQAPGVVRWKRHRAGNGLPRGIGVEIVMGRLLLALASGAEPEPCHARARRFHVAIPATFTVAGYRHQGSVTDLSRSGAFIHCSRPPPVASHTQLQLQLPAGTTVGVQVEVARHQERPLAGFGAHFLGGSLAADAALSSLLAEVGAAATAPVTGRAPPLRERDPPRPTTGVPRSPAA